MTTNVSKIKLRQLKPDDSDLEAIAAELGQNGWDPALNENHPDHLKRFLERDGIYLLAYIDGELAGRAYGYFNVHPNGQHELFIDEVDTKVSFRRRGIGQALMAGMRRHAEKLGADNFWLGTEPGNAAANGLYKSIPEFEPETFVMYTWTLDASTKKI